MAFSRAALRYFRAVRPTTARPQLFRQVARRGYASGGHEAKAGGDAVWAAGAIAVTVPTCWYILSSTPDNSHGHKGHDDHAGDHGKLHDDKEGEKNEEKSEEESDNKDGKDSEKSEDSGSEDDTKESETPDTSDDEGEESDKSKPKDEAAPVKPAGSQNTQSGKQEGISNTDTHHPSDPDNSPNMSKKAEGTETAKAKGTVDPKRPQPEKEKK
ncbi:hypothetical protein B7494_g2086 [Chlorociboria aeruginascens]|nr:hypothetical protein B7494_g2086 [Chlorociboria aeruginascens]